ncbi:MAG: hypothetical protein WDN27_06640 [Candidatus Saccharibacteria bacterium]
MTGAVPSAEGHIDKSLREVRIDPGVYPVTPAELTNIGRHVLGEFHPSKPTGDKSDERYGRYPTSEGYQPTEYREISL